MGLFRRLKAWLFREGDYPSHQVTASPERLAAIVANTNARTLGPPLDLEHGPTENVLDFGRVVPGTLAVEQGAPPGGQSGAWITGDVVVDAAVDDRLKTRGVSILLDANTDTIEKLAVTASPAVTGAQFSTGGTLMKNPLSHLRAFSATGAAAETVSIPAESLIDRIKLPYPTRCPQRPLPAPAGVFSQLIPPSESSTTAPVAPPSQTVADPSLRAARSADRSSDVVPRRAVAARAQGTLAALLPRLASIAQLGSQAACKLAILPPCLHPCLGTVVRVATCRSVRSGVDR